MPWLTDGSHSVAGESVSRTSRVEYSLRNPDPKREMVLINLTLIHAKRFPHCGATDQCRWKPDACMSHRRGVLKENGCARLPSRL